MSPAWSTASVWLLAARAAAASGAAPTSATATNAQADGAMGPYTFGNPIPPGRKIEIQATLHTQNKRGHASSRINMFTNDPRGQVSLGLEAEMAAAHAPRGVIVWKPPGVAMSTSTPRFSSAICGFSFTPPKMTVCHRSRCSP